MSYRGLILDFGGVVTTDLYAEMSAFCVREGLAHDAVVRVLRGTAEGREAIEAVEAGAISQRHSETPSDGCSASMTAASSYGRSRASGPARRSWN
jgi:hypothetical protein